jgi:Zn/Cd-binding protein ZinT
VAFTRGNCHGADAAQNFYVVSTDFGIAPDNFEHFKQLMNENARASVFNEVGCHE